MSAAAVGYRPRVRHATPRCGVACRQLLSAPAGRMVVRYAVIAIVLIALSLLADGWVAEHVRFGRVYETDWGRMLRNFGYLPFWLLAAIALALHDREQQGSWWRRGALLLAAPALAGNRGRAAQDHSCAACARRMWEAHTHSARSAIIHSARAASVFRAATPSSPSGRPRFSRDCFRVHECVWYAAAVGCAVSRLLAHAHYLSDVVAAALIGVGRRLWRSLRWRGVAALPARS